MTLAIVLVLLDLLVIWLLASGRGAWWTKIAALLAACTVNFTVINAFRYGNGFPVGVPKTPVLSIYCYAVEPGSGHPAVYVWGIPQTERGPAIGYDITGAPRGYELPYSKELEQECRAANKAGQQGVPVEVSKRKGKKGKRSAQSTVRSGIHFYSEPPKLLSPKD